MTDGPRDPGRRIPGWAVLAAIAFSAAVARRLRSTRRTSDDAAATFHAVFESAQEVFETGEPKLLSYGIDDDVAWSVGLPCGGEIDVFVERVE